MPDGKLIVYDNKLYDNDGEIANYNSIIFRDNMLVAQSTQIPQDSTEYKLILPKPLSQYKRGVCSFIFSHKSGGYNSRTISINNTVITNYFSYEGGQSCIWVVYFIIGSNIFYTVSLQSKSVSSVISKMDVVPTNNYFLLGGDMSSSTMTHYTAIFITF